MRDEEITDLAEFFKVFGDPTRLKILFILEEGESSVSEIATVTGMSQSAISQQLKILKTSRLVRPRKEGKSIFYRLCDEHISRILSMGKEHYEEL